MIGGLSTPRECGSTVTGSRLKSAGGKFLTFFLDREEYGIEILCVHEIIGMMPVTLVPGTPDYFRGIINLRGQIIPVIDLRKKFGMESKAQTPETCIIVVTIREAEAGIIVDRVSEVLSIADQDIEPTPSFGKHVNTDFILGIGKSQSRVKILLNIDRVICADQLSGIDLPPKNEVLEGNRPTPEY